MVNIVVKIKTVETTFQKCILKEFGEVTRLMVLQYIDKATKFKMWFTITGYASSILT